MNNSQLSSSSRSLELREDLLVAERIISLVADTLERERLSFHHAQTIPALLAYAYRQRARVTDKDATARFGFSKTETFQRAIKNLFK